MTTEANETSTKAPVQQAAQAQAGYPRTELITRAKEIFGVNPEIVVGALHGDNADQFTIDAVKQKIKDFLERKVI